jgi:hypothetical protein
VDEQHLLPFNLSKLSALITVSIVFIQQTFVYGRHVRGIGNGLVLTTEASIVFVE